MDAGAVDHGPCLKIPAVLGLYAPAAVRHGLQSNRLRIEGEHNTVRRGVLGHAQGKLVGTAYAAGGGPQRRRSIWRHVRLSLAQLITADYLDRHSVLVRILDKIPQRRLL